MKKDGCKPGERFDFQKQRCVPHPYTHDPLPTVVKESKDLVKNYLKEYGIVYPPFTVKIKPFTGYRKGWLACNRSTVRFTNPIFWINEDMNDIIMESEAKFDHRIDEYEVITDNIIHEYAHSIYKWAKYRNPSLLKMIHKAWGNEEDFAEGFIDYIQEGIGLSEYGQVIQKFKEDMQ